MIETEAEKAEAERKQAATRKTLHGQLSNQILAMGNFVKTEKLSYKAFQKMFGRSVGARAPGMFVAMLRRKAVASGGIVHEFSTYSTRFSQTCHGCGEVKKKPLSQRWHECDCGVTAQRDLYSAFLAQCVDVGSDALNADQANERWSAVDSLLRAAFEETVQSANGGGFSPSSFGASRSQSGSSAKLSKPD
jgi:hypothetical protein